MKSTLLRPVLGMTAILLSCQGRVLLAQEVAAPTVTAEAVRAETIAQMTPGPFEATFESLEKYQTPEWFRDAKFGIWSHWGPQAAGEMGDRYAQGMYEQGRASYKDHLEKYGHPTKVGYKDFLPVWKAEKWEPEQLMDLYVKAGAKYFVSMAVHHDNFDLWNSKYQPRWNSVAMGPKRDVVGEWQKAAKARGLPFGVSEHLGGSYTWFQTNKGSDKTGPLAGVPYDGNDPAYEDLYHPKAAPGDDGWLTNDPANQRQWYYRMKDLIDKYHPELFYSDSGFPFPESSGLPLVAGFYNDNMQRNNGQLTAVYNSKEQGKGRWIQDLERGVEEGINPEPWQTDTSVGDWFYDRNDKYKTPETVVHLLCDIVSKNGNLLLNMVQRPDGTLDDAPKRILDELAVWIPVNGEAIFGTRPWIVFGEGVPPASSGAFNEDKNKYSAQDVRFTTKNGVLYAIMLGWPKDKRAMIQALASDSPGVSSGPNKVSLLGYDGKLKWKRTKTGLRVELPENAPTNYASVLKIEGVQSANLDEQAREEWMKKLLPPAPPPAPKPPVDQNVTPDANGVLNVSPGKANTYGELVKIDESSEQANIGFWSQSADWISWDKVNIPRPGTYRVSAEVSAPNTSGQLFVYMAGQKLTLRSTKTDNWSIYQTVDLGEVNITRPGIVRIEVRPNPQDWAPINLRGLRLTPVQ